MRHFSGRPIVLSGGKKWELDGSPEYCFIQYMPVSFPHSKLRVPNQLKPFGDLIRKCFGYTLEDEYLYITVKHLWVTPDNIGNRSGWHCDGYLSNDINIVWVDKHPTEFCVQEFDLDLDHSKSMKQMEEQAKSENIWTPEPKQLVMMDERHVHRPPVVKECGFRIFFKASISQHKYNLKGNAHNHLFDYNWDMQERSLERNHPTTEGEGYE